MSNRSLILLLLLFVLFIVAQSKTPDPYKVLGVDKNASQREIQKAFHKLSLQYHPDKNKKKGAQEKFAEINNAYEILSDEEKRKNYDLYGDEKGNTGFEGGNFGSHDGYSHFTTGEPGHSYFTSNPGGWQTTTGGQGNTKTYSFSFGGDSGSGGNPFGFGFGDLFSNMFGSNTQGGKQHGGFGHPGGSGSSGGSGSFGGSRSQSSSVVIEDVDWQIFNKQIKDQGLTWILLFYVPSARGFHLLESVVEDVANSLKGAVRAGRVNCKKEQKLCKDLGASVSTSARLFIYSYKSSEVGAMVEYGDEFEPRRLKTFCQDQLPRFSKRVDLGRFDFTSVTSENLPQVLLLSTKKDTPVMWRAISGLYRKRFRFFDAEVQDVSHPMLKKLGIQNLPAVVGKLVNGEIYVLKQGIVVKDLKSGINDLKVLLDSFEKKNKKVVSSQANRPSDAESGLLPVLTASNFDSVCNENTAVCIIGVFRSSKAKEKLQAILSEVSQKTLTRRQNQAQGAGGSVTYALLDATKQTAFTNAFDSSGYKSYDKFLVAYKRKRGKFAALTSAITLEEVEKFVSSVLNGDIKFAKVRQQPVIR